MHGYVDNKDVLLKRLKRAEGQVRGIQRMVEEDREYRNLYKHFVQLVGEGRSDADFSPLVHVADAFLLGRRHAVEPFED